MTLYRNVKLPDNLVEEIRRIINNHKELGYRSHSEFVIDATRRRLEKVKQEIK